MTSDEAADADASLGTATPNASSPTAVSPDAFSRGTVSDDTSPDRIVPITPVTPVYGDHSIATAAPVAEPYSELPSVAAPPPVTAAPPAAARSAADLPVPGYDQLTLASLRSRLRYLDVAQLRTLADYEKATANRSDFVGMFERRISKLEAAGARAT